MPDVTRPSPGNGLSANDERAFLVRSICREVAIPQVRRDVERVVAVCGCFQFACSYDDDPILTH